MSHKIAPDKRVFLAVSTEHLFSSWKYGAPFLLLGKRSSKNGERIFAGHTFFPDEAELYSIEDIERGPAEEIGIMIGSIAKIDVSFPKYYSKYKYILVKYNDYIRYCKTFGISLILELTG